MHTQHQTICTAPPGQLRIAYVDPRDHWPTKEKDVWSKGEAASFLAQLDGSSREVMVVFDDKGKPVTL